MRGGDSPQIKLLSSSKRRGGRRKKAEGIPKRGAIRPISSTLPVCLVSLSTPSHFYGFPVAKFAEFEPVGVIRRECKRGNIEAIEKQSEKVGKCLSISFLPPSVSPPSSLPFFYRKQIVLEEAQVEQKEEG